MWILLTEQLNSDEKKIIPKKSIFFRRRGSQYKIPGERKVAIEYYILADDIPYQVYPDEYQLLTTNNVSMFVERGGYVIRAGSSAAKFVIDELCYNEAIAEALEAAYMEGATTIEALLTVFDTIECFWFEKSKD